MIKLKNKLILDDIFIIFCMMVLAACGLLYEYVFSHFAGRVLGNHDAVIYGIIGVMVVSMGVGAFLARFIKNPFDSLSIIESIIAVSAVTGIFIISGTNAFVISLPKIMADAYNIPVELSITGGFYNTLLFLSNSTSYVVAAVVGVLIGVEIPLIARIRETIHKKHLEHNTGMIYGVDYIGAGMGAAIWVLFLLKMEIAQSIALVSTVNVLVGFCFIVVFSKITISNSWFNTIYCKCHFIKRKFNYRLFTLDVFRSCKHFSAAFFSSI